MQHLEEGTIHAWLDGALSPAEARDVEEHLASCPECSAMVAEARGLVAGASRIVSSLDVVRGNVIPKTTAARGGSSLWHSLHLTPARAALAATLMIAVSTLLTVRHDTPDKSVMAPEPAAEASVPRRADAPKQAPPSVAPAPAEKDRIVAANKPAKDQPKSVVAAAPASPPAAAAGAAAANTMDTADKKTLAKAAPSADSTRMATDAAVGPGRMQVASRMALSEASLQDRLAMSTCYELTPPPTSATIPHRFALQGPPGDTARQIVRTVNDDGRLDSVLAGSKWTRATATEIVVRFASTGPTMTFPIRGGALGAAPAATERREFAGGPVLSVTRVPCRE
jgi:hypothetical protein